MVEITLSKVAGYVFGVLAITAGLFLSLVSLLVGLSLLLAGLLALPVVREELRDLANISVSRWGTVGIISVLIAVAMGGLVMAALGSGSAASVGEAAEKGNLRVTVVNYETLESVDTHRSDSVDPEASALLVNVKVEHVGENKRVLPHQHTNEIVATYKGEATRSIYTGENITAGGTDYPAYSADYTAKGGDEAYGGTTVSGWVLFEIPPDPDPSSIEVTIHWGPQRNYEQTWDLGA